MSRFALTHEEIVARRRILPPGYDAQLAIARAVSYNTTGTDIKNKSI